jgi:hypothetical protein
MSSGEVGSSDDVRVTDAVILDLATVERDDALKFAARTLENLRYIESVWREHRLRQRDAPVRLVTQTINSLLGLVVFTVERKFVATLLTETVKSLVANGWPAWQFELTATDTDTLGRLAYHLRNGVSHARVRFSSDSADPEAVVVTIDDAHPRTQAVYWRAKITAADLLRFCVLYGEHVDDTIG